MKSKIFFFLVFLGGLPLFLSAQKVVVVKIDGAINPVSASFIHDEIEKAAKDRAVCLVIKLNTPGGLLQSTRSIVSDILVAPLPVVVYVAPSGAHAGSAGVFITLAAHIAAMAPGTNIGAAHPISLVGQTDSVMNVKATNDAAAFIRSIAEKRKRNLKWPEDAVRNSLAITENEALKLKVIDDIAWNERALLNQIDGRMVELNTGQVTLHTKGATIQYVKMSVAEKLLDFISIPDVAYLLLMLGMIGICFELFNPGAILPGIVGVISLILAFYAMNTLPVNYAGLLLIAFALLLFLLEIKITSHGFLATGGVASLLLGSMMLFKSSSSLDMIKISSGIITSVTLVFTVFFLCVIGLGIKAQRLKTVTGIQLLLGKTGEVLSQLDPYGQVEINGEVWIAESLTGKISISERVKVVRIKGLTLFVEPVGQA
ncbi:NfeD family protein [Pedobacter gandavensis]|uniref:Nodulation protein NfeD n=1 Tax=Pedobacter gandavensis TaxID=2679963 RepID=A0ABR6EYG9_9SPHI|nr:nodulation protein NfeD [Pedobacter gandavensis]MBB2150280.1 nodulation protein NfeD [Pedobacter gandavensis]